MACFAVTLHSQIGSVARSVERQQAPYSLAITTPALLMPLSNPSPAALQPSAKTKGMS